MTILRWVGALALALLLAPCVEAQTASSVQAPAGYAPMQAPCVKQTDGTCVPVSAANPLPVTGGGGGGSAPSATVGSASPSTVSPIAGTDGINARSVRTDPRGGLVPSQGVASTTRTTLTASTATALEAAAVAGRIGLTVQIESALSANLFLCTTQATSCSATSYDAMIPSGAGAGTTYTFLFAPSTRIYAFSTGTPVVVLNSWVAP